MAHCTLRKISNGIADTKWPEHCLPLYLHQENRAGSFAVGCWAAPEPVYSFKSHNDLSQQVPGLGCPSIPSMGGSLEGPTHHLPHQQHPKQFRSEGGAFDPCILCLLALPCGEKQLSTIHRSFSEGRGRAVSSWQEFEQVTGGQTSTVSLS